MEIITNNVFDAWQQALNKISTTGQIVDNNKRTFSEIINMIITIEKPEKDIKAPIERLRMIKEWSYPDIEEIEEVIFRKTQGPTYQYTYGARIFNMLNQKNQVDDFIIPLLIKNPQTRKAMITIYNPMLDSNVNATETPCITSIFFKIDEGKLCLTANIRSNEMLIGWPSNIHQLYSIQKYIAEKINARIGSITTISHSAHITSDNIECARSIINKI